MADRFEDLRTFNAIIAAGGINAAAAELGIAKSAVSRRLSDMEKRLGVALVERSGRRLELTALGTEYAHRARAILASLDDLDASLASGGNRPSVTIAAPTALIRHVLAPAIAASRIVEEGVLVRACATLGNEADILIGPSPVGRGKGRRLLATRLVICAAPKLIDRHGHPRDQKGLDNHAAIVVGDGPAEWLVGNRRRAASKVAFATDDFDAAAAAATAGLGMAQLPDYVVADALADGRLVEVLKGEAPTPSIIEAQPGEGAGMDAGRVIDALATAIATGSSGLRVGDEDGGDGE